MKKKRKKIKLTKKQRNLIILCSILLIITTIGITFGRYIYNFGRNYILESQGFYFNSYVLSMNGAHRSINNWDGVSAYPITITVNNQKNDLVYTKSDITYDIEVECSSNIRCVLSKETGIIRSETHVDTYRITVYPVGNFTRNQEAEVTTTARSNFPYVKELSATYHIGIQKSNFSYKITDTQGSDYLTLELTNALTYYKVTEAFNGHSVGDNISIDDYLLLSDENKKKCFSAKVHLSFDPSVILLDMTDRTYMYQGKPTQTLEILDGYNYVNSFDFYMDASSNTKINFYKRDTLQDYTYPGGTDSTIKISVTTAEDE